MERGSDKHGPRLDEELHDEVEPLERGEPSEGRAESFRQPEAERGPEGTPGPRQQADAAGEGEAMSILVRHAMTEAPQTLGPEMNAFDAAGLMQKLDVGVIPIVDRGRLLGLVTDRDIVTRVLAERRDPQEVKLAEILTRSPVTVSPDQRLSTARDIMGQHQIRRLPVVKGEELVGILSMGDVALADESKRAVGEALEDVSESPSTIDITDTPERGTPERVRRSR